MLKEIDLVIATENPGKFKEITAFLKHLPLTLLSSKEFNIPAFEETGLSFVENAILKARHVSKYANLPTLGDDSGLCVDALAGAPGIYSARYAGRGATSQENRQKLMEVLKNEPIRKAYFYCALAYLRHADDPTPLICQGSWQGIILEKEQGEGGFGYDPLFFIPEMNCSAAELSLAQKNRFSHRAKALQSFVKHFSQPALL